MYTESDIKEEAVICILQDGVNLIHVPGVNTLPA
jgi:hypothetical protein